MEKLHTPKPACSHFRQLVFTGRSNTGPAGGERAQAGERSQTRPGDLRFTYNTGIWMGELKGKDISNLRTKIGGKGCGEGGTPYIKAYNNYLDSSRPFYRNTDGSAKKRAKGVRPRGAASEACWRLTDAHRCSRFHEKRFLVPNSRDNVNALSVQAQTHTDTHALKIVKPSHRSHDIFPTVGGGRDRAPKDEPCQERSGLMSRTNCPQERREAVSCSCGMGLA
ncbi:hypothetical protein Bbelb_260830 [Branchiostoma belcheri]|nr:hypothetical protein Bbelb_260830 [Branchiostoma belcheri]